MKRILARRRELVGRGRADVFEHDERAFAGHVRFATADRQRTVAGESRLIARAEPLIGSHAVVNGHQAAADRLLNDIGEFFVTFRQKQTKRFAPANAERSAVLHETVGDFFRRAAMTPQKRMGNDEGAARLGSEFGQFSLGAQQLHLALVHGVAGQDELAQLKRRRIGPWFRADGSHRVFRRYRRKIRVDLDGNIIQIERWIENHRRLAATNAAVDFDCAEAYRRTARPGPTSERAAADQLAHSG